MTAKKHRAKNAGDSRTLYVRNIDPHITRRIRQAAGARGIPVPVYLTQLVDLHATLIGVTRDSKDDDRRRVAAMLEAHGLAPVEA